MDRDEYETLLNTFPPENLANEDDPDHPDWEADSRCRTCASGQPCRERIEEDIQAILTAGGLAADESLTVLQWLIHEGCSSLTRSIKDMTEQFTRDQEQSDALLIAAQNDAFRRELGLGKPIVFVNNVVEGIVVFTPGLQALPPEDHARILRMLREFNAFTPDNDSWNEHDFGVIKYQGERILFKFDYYDKQYEFGSETPANLAATARVLTVMLAHEY